MRKVRGKTMREAGYHTANNICEEIKDVKDDLQTVQTSVLEALADNQSMLSQVTNNIGQHPYHDGRQGFIPPELIPDENIPPLQQSVNSAMTSDSQISQLLKALTQEVSYLKANMQKNQQPFQPPYPRTTILLRFNHTVVAAEVDEAAEVEEADKVAVMDAVAEEEQVKDRGGQMYPSTVGPMAHAAIRAGSVKTPKKVTNTRAH